ncbi:MAG: hypothetical protein ACKOZW_07390 [Cyanobium sp.]
MVPLLLWLAPWPMPLAPLSAAAPDLAMRSYRCAGEPLVVTLLPGPVDAVGIPNTLAGTLPGASLLLRWQGVQRPLPRTNNAGAPSYSDGQWFWQEDGAEQARLLLRLASGDRQEIRCEAAG